MNYSHNCVGCHICHYIRRHLKNFIIKTLCVVNICSLITLGSAIDAIISWQPYVIMLVNFLFLFTVAYVNGIVMYTAPYYERIKKEGGADA